MRKLALLFALYFSQGLPFGFQATALPVYLRVNGVSLTAIGFLGVLAAPWMLKALWAPLVDRYGSTRFGRRKSWIVPMQAGLAGAALLAAFTVPAEGGGLAALLGLVFLMNLFAATQDIAVDGFAVDVLQARELGHGNAAQVVGYKLGMLTGGGLLVWASAWIGWRGLFAGIAALTLVVLLATLFAEEPAPSHEAAAARASLADVVQRLEAVLTLPRAGWLLLFVATYKFGEAMVDVMFKPFLVDAGFAPAQIGLWIGTWGLVASVLGSLAGGFVAGRMSRLGAVGLTAALRVLPLFGVWALAVYGPTAAGVIAVTLAEHFFGGALTTAMFAFMMSKVDRSIGATHFTLLASIEVFGKSPGAWLSGPLAQRFGYAPVFALGAVLSVVFLGLLLPLRGPAKGGEPRV